MELLRMEHAELIFFFSPSLGIIFFFCSSSCSWRDGGMDWIIKQGRKIKSGLLPVWNLKNDGSILFFSGYVQVLFRVFFIRHILVSKKKIHYPSHDQFKTLFITIIPFLDTFFIFFSEKKTKAMYLSGFFCLQPQCRMSLKREFNRLCVCSIRMIRDDGCVHQNRCVSFHTIRHSGFYWRDHRSTQLIKQGASQRQGLRFETLWIQI